MNLIDDWKAVATKAWSMRLALLSAALSALEVAMPYLDNTMPKGRFAILSSVVALAAGVARIVAQPKMRK